MRQISMAEATAVGGGACEDLTFTVGLTNISVSGSLANWGDCLNSWSNSFSDSLNSFSAYLSTGIPYGQAHVA